MGTIDLSLVIPAFNEEKSINKTLMILENIIKSMKLQYEIIVVNDGSYDYTLFNALNYANKNGHVKVISNDKNMGKGYAIRKGFMISDGDIVVFADSDLDINFNKISNYIDSLKYGDIVIASKWHPNSELDIPFFRRILSCGFNFLVRFLTDVDIKDTQSGLKVMKKSAFIDVFPRLSVKRYAFDVELLVVARIKGLKIVEMPTKIRIRGLFKPGEVFRMFIDLLGIAYRLRITHWYQRP